VNESPRSRRTRVAPPGPRARHWPERHQRHRHVRWMRGDAGVASAQDRVDPVDSTDRGTTRARVALVACGRRVIEVRAARTLQQIAANGRLVSQLTRCAGEQRLREDGGVVPGAHAGICGRVGVRGLRARSGARHGQVVDVAKREAADVDKVAWDARSRASSSRAGWLPPLMNFAPGLATALIAARASVARSYVNALMSGHLRQRREWRLRCWGMRHNDRCCRSFVRGSPHRSARCRYSRRRQ